LEHEDIFIFPPQPHHTQIIKMKGHRHNIIFVIAIAIFSWTNALTSTQYQKTGPSPRQSISCRALSTTEDRNINGCTENRHDKRKNWNGLISPYRILHSDFFACTPDPSERKLPLHSSLRLLKRALGMIANNETNVLDDENSTVIRIEHKVSHTVDPLCWLHAQTRLVNKDTALYFATAEGTLETAVYGSAKTHKGTVQEEDYWELVSRLPPRTNIYGGQRFDKDSEIGEEWSEFSKGLWILPAIEIRQERDSHDASTTTTTTTVAVHLFNTDKNNTDGFSHSAKRILSTIQHITDLTTTENAPTTLPPVLSRASNYGPNLDGQEIYERSVSAALAEFNKAESSLEKVVLARRMDLNFGKHAVENVGALDILRKWKFASKPGGHLFYINPGGDGGEFFGCTPERLFQVQNGRVLSEALAGTRPRGSTQAADEELSRQLFGSAKDQNENVITGKCIKSAFTKMRKRGWLNTNQREVDEYAGSFYVRRLRHLQHLCQRFDCVLSDPTLSMEAIRFLLSSLHPTPAVGGLPQDLAMNFIRNHETIGFDRGFYSGPVGFVNKDSAEIFVAIRSGLVCRSTERSKVLVYAGAGIVPGSTVQGEWAETSYKLAVVSSIFPQSPITLQSAPTPNAAWATAFIEELVRNGVTQFYICPGSRSTPLVAAIAKSVRSNVGTVHALSVHDERGAGFRALGWGRGKGHPAAVITSSGTAIANLYPAIIEAGIDGVPLIIVTADRPYESRDSGANQAIDQVKAFSSSYIRWFRDILPPSDEVPVAVTLNDAAHGVNISKERRGPVHFNVQFRENLAPDGGAIRNDNRAGSVTSYDSVRFTETPGFKRWSNGGGQWMKSVGGGESILDASVIEIASLIKQSKRGIIVVGNLRKSTSRSQTDISEAMDLLSAFAQSIGFPIIAGVQGCSMRFESPAVIPFAEHLLRLPVVQDNLKPDLVLQFGTPLVSTEVFKVIKKAMSEDLVQHILIHPHHPTERADPEFTVSHKVDSEILPFTKALAGYLEAEVARNSSQLAPLVNLGRSLQSKILSIVTQAAAQEVPDTRNSKVMTEPEIILCLSNLISERKSRDLSLFLSNSMPVRDAEAFLYPLAQINATHKATLVDTTANRGASGIDGIIASAAGFADATSRRTTLLIGDVSCRERTSISQ
jgi:isochorismate synthase/2-succinyl-5-enolpyruvyl-6-hydroxy-3-cyclohexene-1-carboxylate synthase/2-succinyl-6-hydroxy-2,4-cyclohexadiene-1-carboxylate synthase/O-succinylbenzoate synthase